MTIGLNAHLLNPQNLFVKPTVLGTMCEQPVTRVHTPAFNITYSFINTTIWDVVITDQLNASWEVKSAPATMDDGYVEIRKQYDVRDPRVSLLNISMDSGDYSETLNSIINHFKRTGEQHRYLITKNSIILSYKVYARDLQKIPSVSIPEIGYVVTVRNAIKDRLPVNPVSVLGRELSETLTEHERGFVFTVEIVDPYGKLGDMYINIGGQVSKVRVIRNPNYEKEGIYISRSVEPDLNNPTGYSRTRFEFDDYSKVPLYATPALALTHGDVVARIKEEHELNIQQLKFQHEQFKLDAEKTKMQHTERLQELETEVKLEQNKQAKLKSNIEDLKAEKEKESMMLKHQMEMRALDRKDSSEILKWIPALLVSAGAIMVAVKK